MGEAATEGSCALNEEERGEEARRRGRRKSGREEEIGVGD